MKILLTNDDGIHSPGLWAAAEALSGAGDVYVVAPDRNQSGVGASLTLHVPVRASEVPPAVAGATNGIKAYSVEGTPGDACVLAFEKLVGQVDLVVSGINQGSNLGEDLLVSGTVGAAFHGYMRGCTSVAISVAAVRDTRYDVASSFLRHLSLELANGVSLPPSLLNVNIPNEPADKIQGVRVTRLGRRSYAESVKEGDDRRRKYYWISRDRPVHLQQDQVEGTDTWALRNRYISITPVHSDLTNMDQVPDMERVFQDYPERILEQKE